MLAQRREEEDEKEKEEKKRQVKVPSAWELRTVALESRCRLRPLVALVACFDGKRSLITLLAASPTPASASAGDEALVIEAAVDEVIGTRWIMPTMLGFGVADSVSTPSASVWGGACVGAPSAPKRSKGKREREREKERGAIAVVDRRRRRKR